VLPEPALAPVIPPVTVPTVKVKVLATVAVSPMFVVLPLQIVDVFAVVTFGVGLTVTVIVYTAPAHEPVEAVGVTKY
jgi:hypothetical protein